MHRYLLYLLGIIFLDYQYPLQFCGNQSDNKINQRPAEKTIMFSGYEWSVRDNGNKQGPGPNYFSDKSVWVDANGYLHLLIKRDPTTGEWQCAEVTTKKHFGFGRYEFAVEGAIDKMDKNIVLGLFNYSGHDGLDEMDIEFARWGNSKYPNLNYTVWPATTSFKNQSYTKEFSIPGIYTTQRFLWKKDSVIFTSINGIPANEQSIIANYSFTDPPTSISQITMPIHINLWLFDGNGPEDGKDVEMIVRSFTFSGQ